MYIQQSSGPRPRRRVFAAVRPLARRRGRGPHAPSGPGCSQRGLGEVGAWWGINWCAAIFHDTSINGKKETKDIYIYICISKHISIYIYVNRNTYVYIYMKTAKYVYVFRMNSIYNIEEEGYIYIYLYMYICCIYIYICIYICCIHMYLLIYVYMYTTPLRAAPPALPRETQ